MKTLVTGATGFLGATLTRRLVKEGVAVRAVKREHSRLDLLADVANQVEWVIADVSDRLSLDEALRDVTRVYHCAANIGFDGTTSRSQFIDVNVRGTANMVDAALDADVERFVQTSSIAALGQRIGSKDCMDESTEWRRSSYNSDYGESKYRSELEVQRGIAEGLDAVIVNPSVIMGVGRSGENTMLLVETVRKRGIPFIPVGGTNVVDILDVVDGHIRAMEKGRKGERYLLTGENLSWSNIIFTLADALGVDPPKRSASPALMMSVATLLELGARLIRKRPLLMREAARMSSRTSCYVNEKAIRELGCSFRPFSETAFRIAEEF